MERVEEPSLLSLQAVRLLSVKEQGTPCGLD